MADIMVGSVAVGIVPSAEGFADKLRVELVPAAVQLGEELGKTITQAIMGALGSPMANWSDKAAAEAPAQGEKVADSFADGFRAKLAEAMDDLPPAEIDAVTTEATAKINALRSEMEDLSEAVGITITDSDAIATLDDLKEKLASIRAEEIPVGVDITAATTKIDELRASVLKPIEVPVVVDKAGLDADMAKTDTELAVAGEAAGGSWGSRFKSKVTSLVGSGSSLGNVTSNVESEFAKAGEQAGSGFGGHFSSVMKGAFGPVGIAAGVVVGILGIAAYGAAKFQTELTRLNTDAGETAKNLPMVGAGLKDIASQTGQSLSQLTSGAFMVESAGFHGAAALSVMSAAAQGAKISGADLGTVSNALTTTMVDFGIGSDHANVAMSGLNAIVAHGKTTLEDLASSMSRVLPTASALHISFADVGGAMATMTGEGISAKMAAMGLNSTMLSLVHPNASAAKAMEAMGISSDSVAKTLQQHGLVAALNEVAVAAEKAGPKGSPAYVKALATMMGGNKGLQAALALTGDHLKTTEANTVSVADAMDKGAKSVTGWATFQKTFNARLDEAKQTMENLFITIGQKVLPVFSDVVADFNRFIPVAEGVGKEIGKIADPILIAFFTGLKDVFIALTAGPMKFITLAIIGIVAAIWLMNAAFTVLDAISPFGWVMIAVAVIIILVGVIQKFHVQIIAAFVGLYDIMKKPFVDAINWVRGNWPMLLVIVTGPIGLIILAFTKYRSDTLAIFTGSWKDVTGAVTKGWHDVEAVFTTSIAWVKNAWNTFWSWVSGIAKAFWSAEVALTKAEWTLVEAVWTASINWVKNTWNSFWTAIKNDATAAYGVIKSGLNTFFTNIKDAFSAAVTAIGAIWARVETVAKVPVSFIVNTIYDKGIVPIVNDIAKFIGLGSPLHTVSFAEGGIVPGPNVKADIIPAMLTPNEIVLNEAQQARLGGRSAISQAVGGLGHGQWNNGVLYAGGGFGWNPVSDVTTIASDVASAGASVVNDVIGLGKRLVRGALDGVVAPILNETLKFLPNESGSSWGSEIDDIPRSLVKDIISWIKSDDAKNRASGSVGSGTGAEVAKYAATFATGQGHPYVTGGQGPSGWDCSGFSAYVYEHFGYFPGDQKSRYGTSESQFSSGLLQSSGAVPGALVFFDDGFYANPGHVGVVLNSSSYVGADDPSVGTITAGMAGNVGFRIPKGGFAVPGANLNHAQLVALWQSAGGPGGFQGDIAGAIAMAESGGRAVMQQGQPAATTGWGYWQITPGSAADLAASTNAKLAVGLYNQRGFEPWTTFNDGAYLQYMASGGFAMPGWGWVGEEGPELVRFTGGEQVMSNPQSMQAAPYIPAAGRFAQGTGSLGAMAQPRGGAMGDVRGLERRLDKLIAATQGVGSDLGSSLNGTARIAGARAAFTRRNR